MKYKVFMLVSDCDTSRFMYNALSDEFNIVGVLIDEPVSNIKMIRNRVKRLGLIKVFGQVAFIILSKILSKISDKNVRNLIVRLNLDNSQIPLEKVLFSGNLNSEKAMAVLENSCSEADVVVVNGTRILSKKVLNSLDVDFINTHVGITPKYRGVHGGYWALANNDKEMCGVTVHLVDSGIDTGGVLFQRNIDVAKEDNFFTYPVKQIFSAIPLMKEAINNSCKKDNKILKCDEKSLLWHHPTLFQYLYSYFRRGVK